MEINGEIAIKVTSYRASCKFNDTGYKCIWGRGL